MVIILTTLVTMFYPELSPAMRWHLDHNQKMYDMQHVFSQQFSDKFSDQYGKRFNFVEHEFAFCKHYVCFGPLKQGYIERK